MKKLQNIIDCINLPSNTDKTNFPTAADKRRCLYRHILWARTQQSLFLYFLLFLSFFPCLCSRGTEKKTSVQLVEKIRFVKIDPLFRPRSRVVSKEFYGTSIRLLFSSSSFWLFNGIASQKLAEPRLTPSSVRNLSINGPWRPRVCERSVDDFEQNAACAIEMK